MASLVVVGQMGHLRPRRSCARDRWVSARAMAGFVAGATTKVVARAVNEAMAEVMAGT